MYAVNRRDFLKVSSVFLGATLFSRSKHFSLEQSTQVPNIIILIFDAMSANHLSIYGYPRKTTPNFERFAKRATVYHSNYAPANFTSSGTATLLTGMNPWKHRAFNIGGVVTRELIKNNLFNLLGNDYFSVGFSQNVLANKLLSEFKSDVDWKLSPVAFSSGTKRVLYSSYFPDDDFLSYDAFDEFLGRTDNDTNRITGSLSLGFLGLLSTHMQETPDKDFPYGKPIASQVIYYDNKKVFREIAQTIWELNQTPPFVGYFHFFAPHEPYTPRKDFIGLFEDMPLVKKPYHKLSYDRLPQKTMKKYRDHYDEYIANVDAEFGNLLDFLEKTGALNNSYLVLASDHGEVFERGEIGHGTALLYEPVIHTPLIISEPGQKQRVDVHSPTCNTDLVPTFLHIAEKGIPKNVDGRILPGFGGFEDFDRSIFSVDAKENSSFLPLGRATIALNKRDYKLIHYIGYEKYDQQFELYNLYDDPHELANLFDADTVVATQMKDELLTALDDANRPFRKL
jgi:arylsulfatase A-like enzyme